jgi:hypothetical protein
MESLSCVVRRQRRTIDQGEAAAERDRSTSGELSESGDLKMTAKRRNFLPMHPTYPEILRYLVSGLQKAHFHIQKHYKMSPKALEPYHKKRATTHLSL